jgi:type I restriction enzyme S subunit
MSKDKLVPEKLGDIAHIEMGQSPDSIYYLSEATGVPLIQGNADIKERKSIQRIWTSHVTKECDAGDILMTVRAPVGSIGIASQYSCIGRGVCAIKATNVDPNYLYHLLIYNEENWKALEQGSTFTAVNSKEIFNFPLLTSAKDTQRHIAQILSTANTVVEKTQATISKYKAIKQGMLNDLFTRGIDIKTGKVRPKFEDAPELYKESELGMIPKEWDVKIFGKEVDLIHGHQFRDYDFTEAGIPIAKIGQVKPENLDLSNCSFVKFGREEEFKNEIIRNGDVLMALTGATLGKACLVSGLSGLVLQNYRVGRFEPIIVENDIDKTFLYYLLIAGELLRQIFNKVNSGAQGNVGKADFEKATFKKPTFSEQKIIAERIHSIDKKLQKEQNYLHKLQQIKLGLMTDLLSGNKLVTVPKEIEHQTT